MFKTGNAFIDIFTKGLIFCPLLPAVIIFLRRTYRQTNLNFLMILCLLHFSENLGLLLPGLSPENHSTIKNAFFLLEAVVLMRIIGFGLDDIRLKNALNIFLIAFLSVFLTYFALKGADSNSFGLDIAQHCIFILITMPFLVVLIRDNSLHIFRLPLFWVTAGTLFYFSTILLMEWVSRCCLEPLESITAGRTGLIDIAGIVQYLMYTLATLNYQPDKKEDLLY